MPFISEGSAQESKNYTIKIEYYHVLVLRQGY
jgi:hypothetical protein